MNTSDDDANPFDPESPEGRAVERGDLQVDGSLGPAETRAVERGVALQFGMHIVIAGGPVDGFTYIGPFKTGADAVDWARNADLGADWWTAPLEAKEAYTGLLLTITTREGKNDGTIYLSEWLAEAKDSLSPEELTVAEATLRSGAPYRVDMNLGDWIDLHPPT